MTQYVIDAGAIVALLDKRDRHHDWARSVFSDITSAITCDPVLTEAYFLLGRIGAGDALSRLLERGVFGSIFTTGDELVRIVALMRKFKDVPMSFADACLVRITEIEHDSKIVTTDSDFLVYRRHARQIVPIVAPFK